MPIGFGLVWKSSDLGDSWTAGPSTYGSVVIDAEMTPLVTVPVPGVGATAISIPNVHGFAIYLNGLRLYRNDGTGVDYSYDSTTETATLKIGLRTGDIVEVDLSLSQPGDLVIFEYSEAPYGTINAAVSGTVATGSSTTSFTSATPFAVGTVLLFTGGTGGNVGKSCEVTAVSGSGPWTYTVGASHNTTGLSATPAATDAFTVGYSLTDTPTTNVALFVGPCRVKQGLDFTMTDNIVVPANFVLVAGDLMQADYGHA